MSLQSEIQTKLDVIKDGATLETADTEKFLIQVYQLLDSTEENEYNLCLAAICHVADTKPHDLMVQQLLHDCIVKSRIFLYDNLLDRNIDSFEPNISFQDEIAKSYYTSSNTGTTLTRQQKEIFDLFQEHKRLIVSAPTSFGKTRIISEIIAHNNYRNIALIMPTVSLLSEQFQSIREQVRGYTISKSSKVRIDTSKKHLLILTPERMSIFLEENPDFEVDFFVMDEIYKVDYKLQDDRFHVFSDVLYRLAKTSADFYLIGPYISGFSPKFLSQFAAQLKIFNVEIVQKDFYNFDNITHRGHHDVEGANINVIGDKFRNLVRILANDAIDGKFLIYRYQKHLVEQLTGRLLETWPVKEHNEKLVEYLSNSISPEWNLVACIKRGLAFHHGAMPRHIQDLIVDEFNKDSISGVNYLICTTSLTEGVNTSAKNVVLYDKKIGNGENLKTLDKKNIEGRAGRFMRHFVGRVFYLEEPEQQEDSTVIEIESLDSATPSVEALLQMDDDDLPEANVDKKDEIKAMLASENIPYELIGGNKFVSVEGQVRLVNELRENSNLRNGSRFDGNLPELETSRMILSLIYDNLFTDKNKGRNFNGDMGRQILINKTLYYLYHTPTFPQMLQSNAHVSENINTRIRYTFDIVSKYFEFVWPRYIKTFESLFNFVAGEYGEERINLDMAVATLEYGTAHTHEILLRDAGMPSEIVRKISMFFRECETFEDLQQTLAQRRGIIQGRLHSIEYRIMQKYL